MNVYEDILDLNEKIDENGKIISLKKKNGDVFDEYEEEPVLLYDIINNNEDDENLNEKSNPIKKILEKFNRSPVKQSDENESQENDLYENFLRNKTKIDDDLKLMIKNLSYEESLNVQNEKKNFESMNFSIFSPEEYIFTSIFEQMKILFLKPIMDFNLSTLNEKSKINSDLLGYIDFYIESNIKSLINYFSDEFFGFISNKKNFIIHLSEDKIRESENYVVFMKKAYQKFENLSMFHFRFLDSKINFFNSCLKNLVFLVLQVNFSEDCSENMIKDFLEKFFKKKIITKVI